MAGGALLLTGRSIGDLIGGVAARPPHTRERLASELEQARADARPCWRSPRASPGSRCLEPEPEGDTLEGEEDPLAEIEREIQNRARVKEDRSRGRPVAAHARRERKRSA